MRKISLAIVMALFVSTALLAQDNQEKISGSGNVVTRDITVQPFTEMSISGVFNVILSQGSKEAVKIEAEDNLQELFTVKNDGNKLIVEMKKDINIQKHKQMNIYITFKKVSNMDIKTVGNVSSKETLSFDDLKLGNKSVGSVDLKLTARSVDIENKSVGNMKLDGKAENAVVRNNSVGNFQASSFIVQKMDIDNRGIGSTEVNAEKELKINNSGMNRVKNKGTAEVKKKVVI